MKHFFRFTIIIVLTAISFHGVCSAAEEISTEDIISDQELIDLIPPSISRYFDTSDGVTAETLSSLDGEFFINYILSAMGKGVSSGTSLLLLLLSVVAVTALFNSFSLNLSPQMKSSLDFASSVCCAVLVFSLIGEDMYSVVESVDTVNSFLSSVAPVMSLIYTSAGQVSSAAVSASSTLLTVSLTNMITHNVLMPVLRICFSLEVISAISGKSHLSDVASSVKNTFIFICGCVTAVITAVFTYQTVIAQSADNAVLRTAKFAMGNLPVVGGALAEASRTLIGSVNLVKSITGGMGVCVILLIAIPPLAYMLISKWVLSLSRILATSLECERLSAIIKGGEDVITFSVAIMMVFDIIAIFSVSVFLLITL